MRKRMAWMLSLVLALHALALPVWATPPTAQSFAVTLSTVGASQVQLLGSDPDGTALVFAIVSSPAHGTISGLIAATGSLVYTPAAGYTGADSFTYKVTSGGEDSNTATVSITVSSAKTRIVDLLQNPDGSPRSGKVTFLLTQAAQSPAGIITATSSASAQLDQNGYFDVPVYPSVALSPQSYYTVNFKDATSLREEPIGVYAIPASSTAITLAPYKVTNTNLAAQYTFVSQAGFQSYTQALANLTLNTLLGQSRANNTLQKWNGSNLVNSLIIDNGSMVTVGGGLTANSFNHSSGTFSLTQPLSVTGTANISSHTTIGGNATVTGSVTANSVSAQSFSNPSGTFTLTQPLSVTGATSLVGATTITGAVSVSGNVTANAFVGSGAGLTGIGTGTGGVINTGSTTVGADSGSSGVGIIDLQTRGTTRLRVQNDGTVQVNLGGSYLNLFHTYQANGTPAATPRSILNFKGYPYLRDNSANGSIDVFQLGMFGPVGNATDPHLAGGGAVPNDSSSGQQTNNRLSIMAVITSSCSGGLPGYLPAGVYYINDDGSGRGLTIPSGCVGGAFSGAGMDLPSGTQIIYTGTGHGIQFLGGATNIRFEGFRLTSNNGSSTGHGLELSPGLGTTASRTHLLIHRIQVENFGGAGIHDHNFQSGTISENIIRNNKGGGIKVERGSDTVATQSNRCSVVRNMIDNTSSSTSGLAGIFWDNGSSLEIAENTLQGLTYSGAGSSAIHVKGTTGSSAIDGSHSLSIRKNHIECTINGDGILAESASDVRIVGNTYTGSLTRFWRLSGIWGAYLSGDNGRNNQKDFLIDGGSNKIVLDGGQFGYPNDFWYNDQSVDGLKVLRKPSFVLNEFSGDNGIYWQANKTGLWTEHNRLDQRLINGAFRADTSSWTVNAGAARVTNGSGLFDNYLEVNTQASADSGAVATLATQTLSIPNSEPGSGLWSLAFDYNPKDYGAAGTVNTSGANVTWVSGTQFGLGWTGSIFINGTASTISSVTDATHLVLTASAGTQTGVAYGPSNSRFVAVKLSPTGGSGATFKIFSTDLTFGGASLNTWYSAYLSDYLDSSTGRQIVVSILGTAGPSTPKVDVTNIRLVRGPTVAAGGSTLLSEERANVIRTNGGSLALGGGPALTKFGKYTATLSPAAVSANTCAEQTFTFTGVGTSDAAVGVSKPTNQAGLAVAGQRVTGANSVAINFCNVTASPITPTASEIYTLWIVQ